MDKSGNIMNERRGPSFVISYIWVSPLMSIDTPTDHHQQPNRGKS